ncbi:MAG: cell division protein FtsA [Sphingobacteriia bacterium]|nr:cell division protein FtsA [Sphingobacteriia bacterium]
MKKRSDIVTVIDIGSYKTTCAISKYNLNNESLEILALSYQMSKGVRSGKIIDMNQAANVLAQVIAAAEDDAGIKVEDVVVAISGGKIISQIISSKITLNDNFIKDKDVNRVIRQALDSINQEQYEIIHYIPTEFVVNDIHGVSNPVGMVGSNLTAKINIILAPVTIINNLDNCFARAQVNISDIVIGAYASGLGVLTHDEKELGVTLIEMGSNVTSIAVYDKSIIKFIDTIPVGSQHITNDISHAFGISYLQAERIKALFGSVEVNDDDHRTFVDIENEDGTHLDLHITRKMVSDIIIPRVDEIIEFMIEKIKKINFSYNSQNIVITGGGAQLYGIDKYIAEKLHRKVRVGLPISIMPNVKNFNYFENNPSFSTVSGLINYSVKKQMMVKENILVTGSNNFITKIKNLLLTKTN